MRKNSCEAMLHETLVKLRNGNEAEAWEDWSAVALRADVRRTLPEIASTVAEVTGLPESKISDAWYTVRSRFDAYPFEFTIIREGEKLFPKGLGSFHFLYAYGNLDLLTKPLVACLGMRLPSEEGRADAVRAVREARDAGAAVLGTLDTGLDAYSALYAYNLQAPFVAVLQSPLHQCVPESQAELMVNIANSPNGLLVTPFSPCRKAEKWFAVPRNEVLSAMATHFAIAEEREGGPLWRMAASASSAGKPVMLFPSALQGGRSAEQARELPGVKLWKRNGDLRKLIEGKAARPHKDTSTDWEQLELF